MKHYNYITSLEINEVETVVSIDFESDGFEVEIIKMTDMETGDCIAPDLGDELTEVAKTALLNELMEFAADFEHNRRSNSFYSVNL